MTTQIFIEALANSIFFASTISSATSQRYSNAFPLSCAIIAMKAKGKHLAAQSEEVEHKERLP